MNAFQRTHAALESLLPERGRLRGLLEKPADETDSFQAVRQRLDAVRTMGGKPVLVATLYGPTGAGKSTLFRLLTGVPVPAGSGVRPVSYGSAIAVPPRLNDPLKLHGLFPHFDLQALESPDDLKDKASATGRVFHTCAPRLPDDGFALVVADVPDFNSVEKANWDKAERMLERAELVLFVATSETYADHKVMQELHRCCRLAGRLAYVLTKKDRKNAKDIWHDLTTAKTVAGSTIDFQQKRLDGRTLQEFLTQSAAYYSPHSDDPRLEHVDVLRDGSPEFKSLLHGLDAERILTSGLLEPARGVQSESAALLKERQATIDRLKADLAIAWGYAPERAKVIARSEFPIGRFLQVLIDESQKQQRPWLRYVTTPFRLVGSFATGLFRETKGLIDRLFEKNEPAIRDRRELEKEKMQEAVDRIAAEWRGRFPDEAREGGLLEQSRLNQFVDDATRNSVPDPSTEWENEIRDDVRKWGAEHPWMRDLLPTLSNMLQVAGLGLLVADISLTGGSIGTIGALAAGGSGGLAFGELLKWINKLQLKAVVEEADVRWSAQRARECEEHLRKRLHEPVFAEWTAKLSLLEAFDPVPLRNALAEMDAIDSAYRRAA